MITIFKKIRFKNIMSYGNQMTEIDLDKSSTTLLVGINGQGKCLAPSTTINVLEDNDNKGFIEFQKFLNSK